MSQPSQQVTEDGPQDPLRESAMLKKLGNRYILVYGKTELVLPDALSKETSPELQIYEEKVYLICADALYQVTLETGEIILTEVKTATVRDTSMMDRSTSGVRSPLHSSTHGTASVPYLMSDSSSSNRSLVFVSDEMSGEGGASADTALASDSAGPTKVLLTGVPKGATADGLVDLLENVRRQGGGEVRDINIDRAESTAIVEFVEPEAVDILMSKAPIKYHGQRIQVEVYRVPDEGQGHHSCTVEVRGLPDMCRMSQQLLEMYFESQRHSNGAEVEQIDFHGDKGIAYVTFKSPEVAQRVLAVEDHNLSEHPFQVVPFNPTQSKRSALSTVEVRGFGKDMGSEKLEHYFRTENGYVKMNFDEAKGVAYVTFTSEEAVDRVVQRTHVVDGKTLSVKPFVECLGHSRLKSDIKQPEQSWIQAESSAAIFDKCFEEYKTQEGIRVCVYEGNLLKVPVDCIVNAANENLQHGGGVARAIAVGAGSALTQEGNAYIRQNGCLRVGTACSTTAGKLPYCCVIHTVGPCWYDYSPHSQGDVNRCEADLYNAIMNSFLEAEKKSLKSIALPAVSAATFGVPEMICVAQYVRATVDYSRRVANVPKRLTEIHFVDKNRNIVLQIQSVFKAMLKDKQQPFDNKQKQSRHSTRGHSSSSTGYTSEQSPPESLLSIAGSQVTSTSSTLCSVVCYDQKIAGADHLICRVGSVCKINVYRAYIVELKDIDMCVCSDDNRGSGKGAVVSRLIKKGGPGYVDARQKEFKLWQTDGAVVVTHGGNTGYKHILHGVLRHDSEKQERMILLRKIFASVMIEVGKHKAGSMVLPLIGIGKTPSQADIQEWVDLFMEFYCSFSLERKDNAFTVHLVCKEISLINIVKEALKRFGQNLQQQDSSPNTGDSSGYNKDELLRQQLA